MARVVVVGAGLGGLSAAAHLRRRGHDVEVFERGDTAGGRAGARHVDGYRFDTGPTVLTMRPLLEATFDAAGAELDDYVALRRLDPAYRAVFADGSEMRLRAERAAMAAEIRAAAGPANAAGYERFADWVTDLYRVEFAHFIDRDFGSPAGLFRSPVALARLVALGGFRRLDAKVAEFFPDERLRRLFSFQALYAGLSPLHALALYGVISYMDSVAGVWYPDGGIHAVASGLAAALAKNDVEFSYEVEVSRVLPARAPRALGGTCAIETACGRQITADAVVVNPDLPIAYGELLHTEAPRSVRRAKYSPSCIVWHLGVRRPEPAVGEHHNVHFSAPWAESFDELLRARRPMSDPSRLVTVASRTDASAAPTGRDTLYVLEPVPNLDADLDWSRVEQSLTERMLAWLGREGYAPDPPEVAFTVAPRGWRAQGMARGTPFAIDHRFTQSGPFRPALTDARLPGIVFAGSATRPGVGVPMVLVSGRLAADRVEDYLGG